ncbi:MAG: glutamine amidotransferase [Gemmatales bacterium]
MMPTLPSTLSDWMPTLEPVLPLLLILVVGVVIIVLTLWSYAGSNAKTRRLKYTLIILRLLALVVALFIMLRPVWVYKEQLRRPGKIVVLVDSSRSMQVKDAEPEGNSRWLNALKEWDDVKGQIETWEKDYQLRVLPLAFDTIVKEFTSELKPEGANTGLLSAVEQVLEKHKAADLSEGEQLLGIVILSDGRDNLGRPTVDVLTGKLEAARCQLHTIALGKPGASDALFDIAALNIFSSKTARIKDRFVVRGELQANRAANQELEVYLLIDGKVATIAEGDRIGQPVMVQMRPRKPSEVMRVEFPAARLPETPGDYRFSLFVKPLVGEASENNNEISTYVTLNKDGLSVLYIDKDRAWEPKFLKRALKGDERISLIPTIAGAGTAEWRRDIRNAIKTQNYDVFIIGDVPASRFDSGGSDESILKLIADQVKERGAGLVMIGGHDSFADGGWDKSPLAEVLPVQMNQKGQLEGDIGNQREIKFKITEESLSGARFPFITRLDSDPLKNREWWNKLPPLDGGSKMGNIKGNGALIAATDQREPLLVVQEIGKGRTAALAVDTTWRWVRPGPAREEPIPLGVKPVADQQLPISETTEAHLRFWRQLILWLARQEQAGQGLNLELASRRVLAGKEMSFTLQAREVTPGSSKDSVKPIEGAEYTVRVVKPNKETEVINVAPLGDAEAKSRGIFWKTDEPGEYTIIASARAGGKEIGTAQARFMSTRDDSETLNQAANHTLMEQLATSTGGTFRLHGGLRDVIEKVSNDPANMDEKRIRFPDWQEPSNRRQGILFALFVACIVAEWIVRRWWGMV